jgi:hypothetical protein
MDDASHGRRSIDWLFLAPFLVFQKIFYVGINNIIISYLLYVYLHS